MRSRTLLNRPAFLCRVLHAPGQPVISMRGGKKYAPAGRHSFNLSDDERRE